MTNEANGEAQPQETVAIKIILTKEGQLRVESPFIGDRTAMYGMLETAKDAVREAHHRSPIIKPQGNFLGGLRENGVGKR